MTALRLLLIICYSFVLVSCWKHSNHPTDKSGLPPATQSGANTLGFLLNGETWVPAGNNGRPRVSNYYDPLFNNGDFVVSAYRDYSETNEDFFGLGIIDSMNFLKAPKTFSLTHTSLLRVDYSSLIKGIDLYSTDDTTYCSGSLTLTRFDTSKGIVSGTFNVVLASPHTDTLRITDGRFDVKL